MRPNESRVEFGGKLGTLYDHSRSPRLKAFCKVKLRLAILVLAMTLRYLSSRMDVWQCRGVSQLRRT